MRTAMSEYVVSRDEVDSEPTRWEWSISFKARPRADVINIEDYRQSTQQSANNMHPEAGRSGPTRPAVVLEEPSGWDQDQVYRMVARAFSPHNLDQLSRSVDMAERAMAATVARIANQQADGPPWLSGMMQAMNYFQDQTVHGETVWKTDTASPKPIANIMSLCDSPQTQEQARRMLDRRPELAKRVQMIRDRAHQEFADADISIESMKFDEWDPALTVTIHAYMPFDEFWRQRDDFDAWITDQGWIDDPDLGVSTFYAGDHR